MSAPSHSTPLDALLEHEAFVRALARRLLGDEHAADDLAQETWTDLFVNPPRAVRSMRAWLAESTRNRAANVRRAATRRTRHEERSARVEARTEPDVVERVELESRVVRAVLALREPYRSVVLGRYYEGLSTKDLAARQGVVESSVRSQEARALEMLRAELDRTFDGGREAWGMALAGWLGGAKPSAAPVFAWSAAFAGIAGLSALVWFAWRAPETSNAVSSVGAELGVLPANDEAASAPLLAADLEPNLGRQAATTPVTPLATRPDFSTAPIDALLVLGQQIQRDLRTKLLTPEPEFVARFAERDHEEYGVARILDRDWFGQFGRVKDALGIIEGGAYFSFVTRTSVYGDLDTLTLSGGSLQPSLGAMLHLGSVELDDLRFAPGVVPDLPDPDERLAERWALLWGPIAIPTQADRDAYVRRLDDLELRRGYTPVIGATYAIRVVQHGDYDLLVALQVLAEDEYGVTFAWRVLHTWPLPTRQGGRWKPTSLPALPASPGWLAALDVQGLLALQAELRKAATARLYELPADLPAELLAHARQKDWGAARLLDGGRFEALVEGGGGGAYLNFLNGARTQDNDAPMRMISGGYDVGCWGGDFGCAIDVGDVDLATLVADPARPPAGLSPDQLERWRLATGLRAPVVSDRQERRIRDEDGARIRSLGLESYGVPSVGHTFLVRSIPGDPRRPDLIVAFRDVAEDAYGHTIVWRILQRVSLEYGERR